MNALIYRKHFLFTHMGYLKRSLIDYMDHQHLSTDYSLCLALLNIIGQISGRCIKYQILCYKGMSLIVPACDEWSEVDWSQGSANT